MSAPGQDATLRWPGWKVTCYVVVAFAIPFWMTAVIKSLGANYGPFEPLAWLQPAYPPRSFWIHISGCSLLAAWWVRFGILRGGLAEFCWNSALLAYLTCCLLFMTTPFVVLFFPAPGTEVNWASALALAIAAPLAMIAPALVLAVLWAPFVWLLRLVAPPPKDRPDRLRNKLRELRKGRKVRQPRTKPSQPTT